MQNYFIFLDYLELRRRIEKRLAKINWLLLHTIFFVFVVGLLLAMATGVYYYPREYFVFPGYGNAMTAWSIVLMLHTLWTFSRSGASEGRRNQVIEYEMRERIQNNDTYLSDNPKDLFRIHGLLDEDIQKRAGIFFTLRFFAILNALIWLGSAAQDGLTSSFPWQIVPLLGIAFLPILAFGIWRRTRHERQVRKLLSSVTIPEQNESDEANRRTRLSDDGELIDYVFDDYDEKKKKRDGVE